MQADRGLYTDPKREGVYALVQLGVWSALLTVLGFVFVNMVLGNIIEPKLKGKGLSLSTLVVFLSMVFWGWFWDRSG